MNKIKIETLGCRLNQIESESVARFFLDNNFSVSMEGVTSQTPSDSQTLLYIINTCTVTQKAEQKARRIIRLALKKNENALILVTGCYAQLSKSEIEGINSRVCVIGGQIKSRLSQIPEILRDFLDKQEWNSQNFRKLLNDKILCFPQKKKDFPEDSFKLSTSSFIAHSRASLKIQDGCNNACSYCAIHFARGHSVSIDVETAVARVKDLELAGHDEVVLTTINIGQYKSKYNDKEINFAGLLKILLDKTEKINFRISSLYPEVVNDDFCQIIKNERVRPHFHISVQSGSDKILTLMNRVYKSTDVLDACEKIRKVKNNSFIACDIITGFPNETEEDFIQTFDLCKKCDFAWVHAFPFSERPGTPAAKMKNKVPQKISGERAKKLTEWAIENKINYLSRFVGKQLQAILETVKNQNGICKDDTFVYHAVTENFIHCEIVSQEKLQVNKSIKVEITEVLKDRILKGGDIEVAAKIL